MKKIECDRCHKEQPLDLGDCNLPIGWRTVGFTPTVASLKPAHLCESCTDAVYSFATTAPVRAA